MGTVLTILRGFILHLSAMFDTQNGHASSVYLRSGLDEAAFLAVVMF